MRQKTYYSVCPQPLEINRCNDFSALITFTENAEEIEQAGGTLWRADSYALTTAYTPELEARIRNDYDLWMIYAKEKDYENTAKAVRDRRDKLLAESDKEMAFDRMGLSAPEGATFTVWLSFLRKLGATLTGEVARYRQALRDIPQQSGFPYEVTWPEMG